MKWTEEKLRFTNANPDVQEAIMLLLKSKGVPVYEGVCFPDTKYPYLAYDGKDITQTKAERGEYGYKDIDSVEEFISYFTKPNPVLELTNDYEAVVNYKNSIVEVGCQKIPFEKVKELYELTIK
jgi:hypothetical protein